MRLTLLVRARVDSEAPDRTITNAKLHRGTRQQRVFGGPPGTGKNYRAVADRSGFAKPAIAFWFAVTDWIARLGDARAQRRLHEDAAPRQAHGLRHT